MKIQDDRTPEELASHDTIIAAINPGMSGWSLAQGGVSYCGWACRYEDAARVERWVRSRGDMQCIRMVGSDWRPRGPGYYRINVVRDGHMALE